MATSTNTHEYRGKAENKNAVKSTKGAGNEYHYKPTKKERDGRTRVWDRFNAMKDDPLRKEAEREWDLGDKMYSMWAPEREEGDWKADVILPDAFSAVQSHMQETVDLRPRPMLEGVEASDAELESYNNHIFQHSMDVTDFDDETHQARNCSAIRGTAFTLEEYRYETREVMDPDSVEAGEIKYKKREIVDYDDVYTRFIENNQAYFDPGATAPKYGVDCIYREVLPYDSFKALYEGKPGFKNVEEVVCAGKLGREARFFKIAEDMTKDDVELLHYWNKLTDSYDVLANNVLIRQGPMPSKHKELPMDVWNFYPQLGRIYGMGIPKIIYTLVEERRSNHNIIFDRGKMQGGKMFLVNDLFDLDEDDLAPRPHGMIKVNTNGLPISQAVMPLEYGDIPGSSIKIDEMIKEDERRAHGMDDRPAQSNGGTAFEAAVIKESTQKRINLINTISNRRTLIGLGRKKWSNVQFYYPAGRTERIMENNKWVNKQTYRTVKIDGLEYKVVGDEKDPAKPLQLKPQTIVGKSRLKLDPTYARFMEGNFDLVVDAASNTVVSKPIKQAKVVETATFLLSNPILARYADGEKIFKRIVTVNEEALADWMKGDGMTDEDMATLAEQENGLFVNMQNTKKIFMLPGTPGATEAHTLVHLHFTNTPAYLAFDQPVKDAFDRHVYEENEANPNTANIADMAGGGAGGGSAEPGGGPEQGGGGNAVLPGNAGGPEVPQGTATEAAPAAPVAQ